MLNIFVSALSFETFHLSGSKFQRETACRTTSHGTLAQLATFMIILVATIFSTRHGDKNGHNLER